MYDIGLLIGENDSPAAGGATFDRLNPVTSGVATRAAAAAPADCRAACDAAAAAFPAWSETPPSARRAILNKAADGRGVVLADQQSDVVHGVFLMIRSAWDALNCQLEPSAPDLNP